MKQVTRIVGMMCLTALLAVGCISCKKNDKATTSSFTFTLPEVEGFAEDDSKAYIDFASSNYPMKWWEGDALKIYSVDATNTTPTVVTYDMEEGGSGKVTANFSGDEIEKGSYGYFAFYPATKFVSVSEGNFGTFKVEETQTFNPDMSFAGTSVAGRVFMDPQCAVAASTCDILNGGMVSATMNHIFGFANVRLKDMSGATSGKKVAKVEITDNTVNLTGNMTINIPEITTTRLNDLKTLGTNYSTANTSYDSYMVSLNNTLHDMGYSTEPNGKKVALVNCAAAGDAAKLTSSNKLFIISLRPGALLKGFSVKVTFDDNTSKTFDFNDFKYIIRPGVVTNIQCTF